MGKIRDFLWGVWVGLSLAGRIILGLILLAVIALIVFSIVRSNNNDDDKDESANRPEVAQVYEPSIGSPLPADTPGNASGSVDGASTNTPSTTPAPQEPAAQTMMTAPPTGVDPKDPIEYESTSFQFAAILPPYSQVKEQVDSVTFTSNKGTLQYKVSVQNAGNETLQTIESQLRNSPSASNLTSVNFAGQSTLKFSAQGFGSGIVFIANGKIYYLLGNSQYFADFKIL